MEAWDGWSRSQGEYDDRKYFITTQNLQTLLIEKQQLIIGESVVRDMLDLNYSQLQSMRSSGYVDIGNYRHLITLFY